MRKMLLFFLLIPAIGMSQNNVVSTFRVFPKTDKLLEFEKAFAAHAQKYHTGNWKWRVLSIESGPDAGGFHVVEGPLSWDQLDKRGDLGKAHTEDWAKNVAPLTLDRGSTGYSEYSAELSNVAVTDYTDKIIITHMYPKSGMINQATALVRKMKNVWVASNESVAVYRSVASGPPQFAMVARLKGGLNELTEGFRKPIAERYDAANGAGSWTQYLADYANAIEQRWSEMLFVRADLSSK
ncbi:MAG TPA: hypothetical protein VLR49_00895 [Ferruginibacter sp.]|nr:hypothetical protein [Ferruginibacter sp.]